MTSPHPDGFSDFQIKELRDKMEGGYYCYDGLINRKGVKALLHRLECAEELIEKCGQDIDVSKAYAAWLASKGSK